MLREWCNQTCSDVCWYESCKLTEACTKEAANEGMIRWRLEDIVARLAERISIQRGLNSTLEYKLYWNVWTEWCCEPEQLIRSSIGSLTITLNEQLGVLGKLQLETCEFVDVL